MCNPDFIKAKKASTSSSTTISPVISSGFARRKVALRNTMMGLLIVYELVIKMFENSTTAWLRPADEFCKEGTVNEDGTCSRSDLFASQAASAIMQLFTGGMGFYAWHWTKKVVKGIPQTPEGRLFGYLEEADQLLVGILVYQTFDLFKSWLLVPEHNNAVFLAHHALAAFTAWMSLEYQMVHYYAVFFGGCSEISTIFLVLCDFDTYFPVQDPGSAWGMIIQFCQIAFTISFLYYRVIGWWQVSFGLWSDIFAVSKKGVIENYRPGKAWFLYAFLAMDFLLGSLQVYWFLFGIVPKILEIL